MLALSGTGIGRGIAIGCALVLDKSQNEVPQFQIDADRVDREVSRFNEAIATVRRKPAPDSTPRDRGIYRCPPFDA